jgi:hypothetical protein
MFQLMVRFLSSVLPNSTVVREIGGTLAHGDFDSDGDVDLNDLEVC